MDDVAIAASTRSIPPNQQVLDVVDLLELRLDFDQFDPDRLRSYAGPPALILTNRPIWAGGEAEADPTRLERLAEFVQLDSVWAVDLEHGVLTGSTPIRHGSALDNLLDELVNADKRLICSHHEFDGTPSVTTMLDLLASATRYGDIGKLVVTPTDPAGLGRLVEATVAAIDRGLPVTTMALGSHALLSRLVAIALGCSPVYGHLSQEHPIAPGQPAVETLREVVNALNTERRGGTEDGAATR